MKIGGFIPFSLSDYPGQVAAIVFLQGCNFRCPYCHNASLISQETPTDSLIPGERILRFLETRRGKLDGVVVSGGEPTLQPDLAEFCRGIKDRNLRVKLDTNGSQPSVLQRLLRGQLIDFIAMDIKAPPSIYERLCGVQVCPELLRESIAIIAQSGIAHEFRTTVVEALLSREDIRSIRRVVPKGSPHRLQVFRPENALEPWLQENPPIPSSQDSAARRSTARDPQGTDTVSPLWSEDGYRALTLKPQAFSHSAARNTRAHAKNKNGSHGA